MITLDSWTTIMFNLVDGSMPAMAYFFCCLLVILGSFFMMNLILAVMMSAFAALHMEEMAAQVKMEVGATEPPPSK